MSNDIHSTTQIFLDIYDISNNLLILRDGSTSLVLTVNAINFGLLAEEEQDAIIYSYAGLLNSLNYPIQIVIRSQTKDVTNYLNLVKEQEDKAPSNLRKLQIKKYREYVGNLVKERNVLDKKFYVIIPANSLEMGFLPPSTVIPGVKSIDISTIERSVIIEKARGILEPKRDHLISQFGRIGLLARQLSTQELIQLYYLSYNPEAAEGQLITDTNNYTSAVVSAQIKTGWLQKPPPEVRTYEQLPQEEMTTEQTFQEPYAQQQPYIEPQPQQTQDLTYEQGPQVENAVASNLESNTSLGTDVYAANQLDTSLDVTSYQEALSNQTEQVFQPHPVPTQEGLIPQSPSPELPPIATID